MCNKILTTSLFVIALIAASGCVKSAAEPEKSPAAIARQHNSHAREIEVQVPKREFMAASRNVDQIRRLRLVEVTASEDAVHSTSPEYRLFNIQPQSAYALLGLEDGDVLVSANDYSLNDPEVFRQYVQVLHAEKGETFIEIRRNGEEIVLSFSFIE